MNTCPRAEGKEENECFIKEFKDGDGKVFSYSSIGCDQATQFCKYVGDPEAYNDFSCFPRLGNTEECDNSMQCMSHMCSQFIHKTNTCYECFADKTETLDRGKEISNNHC